MNMMRNYGHYAGAAAHRKFGQEPLTVDELRAACPAIFAETKHESRSERYTYLPTIDVVKKLGEEGFDPYTVKQGKTRIEGKENFTKHMIRFRHRSLKDVRSGDSVLEIALLNSHDGTSAWEIMGAMWRVSCLNALVSGGQLLINHKVPHKGDQLHNVVEGTYRVLEESKVLAHVPDAWSGVTVQADEARAFAKAAHILRFEDDEGLAAQLTKPEQLLHPRREADRGNTLWQTFNRVQENVIKGGIMARGMVTNEAGQRRVRNTQTRPVNAIDGDVKLNRALWVLAEEMAKLKGAA